MKRLSRSDAAVAPDDDIGAKGNGNAPTAAEADTGCNEALQSTSEFIWQGHTGAVTSMLLLNGRLDDAKYAKPDPDDAAAPDASLTFDASAPPSLRPPISCAQSTPCP